MSKQAERFLLLSLCVFSFLSGKAVAEDTEYVEERRLRLWSNQLHNPDLIRSTYLRVNHLEGRQLP